MGIDRQEMPTPQKAPMCGKRTGMRRPEYPMAIGVDHLSLLTRGRSPQNEDQSFPPLIQYGNDSIRELLPTAIPMTMGLMGPNSQHSIQQENALVSPGTEIPMRRNRHARRRVKFLEYISQ
jgi:hypothetical protein